MSWFRHALMLANAVRVLRHPFISFRRKYKSAPFLADTRYTKTREWNYDLYHAFRTLLRGDIIHRVYHFRIQLSLLYLRKYRSDALNHKCKIDLCTLP